MLCYKDRTFCSAECAIRDCYRNMTPEVIEAATVWSAGFGYEGAFIATADFSVDCPDYSEIKEI